MRTFACVAALCGALSAHPVAAPATESPPGDSSLAALLESITAREPALSVASVDSVLAQVLPTARAESGDASVTLATGGSLLLARRDVEHYSSVAYSLRVLLAVQQDALMEGEASLLTLSAPVIAALKERRDLATLAALSLADHAAREGNQPVITEEALAAAWNLVAGAPRAEPQPPAVGAPSTTSTSRPDSCATTRSAPAATG